MPTMSEYRRVWEVVKVPIVAHGGNLPLVSVGRGMGVAILLEEQLRFADGG